MVVKDRLSELRSKSKYLTDNSSGETIFIEASDDKKLSLDTAEKIILNLRDIRKNVGDMENLESQILMEPSRTGREKLQEEHNDLVESTSKLATEIQGLVKAELGAVDLLTSKPSLTLDQFQELRVRTGIFTRSPDTQLESSRSGKGKVNHKYKSVWLSHEYPWVRQTLVSSLARCFQEAWAEFSRVQVQFRQQNKEALLRKVRITEKELSQEAVERKVASGDLAIFSQEDNSQAEAARLQLVAIGGAHRYHLDLDCLLLMISLINTSRGPTQGHPAAGGRGDGAAWDVL